jgi:hypothetical protein
VVGDLYKNMSSKLSIQYQNRNRMRFTVFVSQAVRAPRSL